MAYPNMDPYYGSLYAAYGGQPMVSSIYAIPVVGIFRPT
jgi:hypothetical protein